MKARKLIAEFFGTFQLVVFGTGSILFVQDRNLEAPDLWIGITFGVSVALGIILFGKISGAHMNPAVTIGFYSKRETSLQEMIAYLMAQFLGALVASWSIYLIFGPHEFYGDTLPKAGILESFLLEFGLTFVLMGGILISVLRDFGLVRTALFVGAIVGLEAYFAGPYCGASMNPARSFGPAIVSQHLTPLWIYILAPTAGALSAVLLFRLIRK